MKKGDGSGASGHAPLAAGNHQNKPEHETTCG